MATQTRFNLNTAVENWRNELAAQPQLSSDDRRELEKHLADTMAELRQCGLSEEESFWLARRRIGQPQQLADEFQKANPTNIWRDRVFWMAIGILVFWQVGLVIAYVWGIVFQSVPGLIGFYQFTWRLFQGIGLLLMGILLAKGFLGRSKLFWFFQSRVRLTVLLVCLPVLCDLAQQVDIVSSHGNLLSVNWESRLSLYFRMLMSYFTFNLAPLILCIWFLPKQFKNASTTTKLA